MNLSESKPTAHITRIARRAFPDYRGRTIRFDDQWEHLSVDSYWGDGSRSYWAFVRLADQVVMNPSETMSAQFDCKRSVARDIDLVPGLAAVEHIIFCGKNLGLRLHLHPQDRQRLIEGGAA